MRVRERRPGDPAQLRAPDELVVLLPEDPEVDEILGLAEAGEPALLHLEREEGVASHGFPGIEENAVARQHLEQLRRVADLELAQVDAAQFAYSNGANTVCRPATS